MRYLDVCSGISAPTMAWKPLGWQALCFAEIEAAPRAVLSHHYPQVPLVGDFTTIRGDEYGPVDLLVGGTPCQSFSVAGLRGGLADERGNLALEFLRLADRSRARWLVFENVPGLLSSNGGRDFGSFLGGLAELGYGWAYAVLDAQWFGVPQRRRRVFAVGYLGDWRRAAAVLFERHSLSGDTPPRRETRSVVAALTADGVGTCGADDNRGQAGHLIPQGCGGEVASTINAAFGSKLGGDGQTVGALAAEPGMKQQSYVAFQSSQSGVREVETAPTLDANNGSRRHNGIATASAVRRLTPRECERLQGFPDDFTLVPYRKGMMADGPRYKMLGNSVAVPVVHWIGERIAHVDAILESERAAA